MYTCLCAHTHARASQHTTPWVLGRLHVRKCAHCTQGTRGAEPRPQGSTAAARALPTLLPVIALKQEDETELSGGVARKKLWCAGGLAVPSWSGRGSLPAPGAGQRGCASRKQALPPGQTWPCCGAAQGVGGGGGPGAGPQGLTEFRQDVLLLLPAGKEDLGVQPPHAGALPGRSLPAGPVSGLHLHLKAHLEQIWVFLLNVTGVQVIPAGGPHPNEGGRTRFTAHLTSAGHEHRPGYTPVWPQERSGRSLCTRREHLSEQHRLVRGAPGLPSPWVLGPGQARPTEILNVFPWK